MNLIVAVDKEWGIGNKGDLLARVKGDLMNFRRLTEGKVVVYGFNTLATFPGANPLKKRTNIVLTRKKDFCKDGLLVANSIDDLLKILENFPKEDVFVIGGESIYRQLLPYCDKAYVTFFDKSYEKDAYMPNLDDDNGWVMTEKSQTLYSDGQTDSEDELPYVFTIYEKR